MILRAWLEEGLSGSASSTSMMLELGIVCESLNQTAAVVAGTYLRTDEEKVVKVKELYFSPLTRYTSRDPSG